MTAESIVQQEAPESIAARKAERTASKIREVVADATAAPPVERISADEMAEVRGLAQAFEQRQQEAAQAQEAATKALGALEYVGERLRAKYGIGPQDGIQPDGTIVRVPTGE